MMFFLEMLYVIFCLNCFGYNFYLCIIVSWVLFLLIVGLFYDNSCMIYEENEIKIFVKFLFGVMN